MRERINPRMRFEILTRDGYRCSYCGATPDDAELHVDHVIPVALGGRTVPENLVTACQPCNAGKSSMPPGSELVAAVERDALRWASAIRRAADARRVEHERMAAIAKAFAAEWDEWTYQPRAGARRRPMPRADDWEQSITRFVSLGLDLQALSRYLTITMQNTKVTPEKCWLYFCGCCWNGIQDLQTEAKQLLEEDDQ